jgi:hypothetical protein
MSAFNQPGESWEDFATRSMADCRAANEQMHEMGSQPGALLSLGASNARWSSGECSGCGAIWQEHPLQNALAKGAGECSYCRRPRR